jgi:hypothetical protein
MPRRLQSHPPYETLRQEPHGARTRPKLDEQHRATKARADCCQARNEEMSEQVFDESRSCRTTYRRSTRPLAEADESTSTRRLASTRPTCVGSCRPASSSSSVQCLSLRRRLPWRSPLTACGMPFLPEDVAENAQVADRALLLGEMRARQELAVAWSIAHIKHNRGSRPSSHRAGCRPIESFCPARAMRSHPLRWLGGRRLRGDPRLAQHASNCFLVTAPFPPSPRASP